MDNRFDWQSYLTTAYGSFPEAKRKPVIGLTGNYGELVCKLNEGYYKSIWRAGGVPVIIPPIADTDVLINTLEHIDGLLLTGGADFNPLYAGEEPSPRLGGINAERDLPELLIAQLAYNRQIPMLGICRGIQTLAMALGGKVQQDISDVAQIRHSQDADRSEPTHSVTIEPDSTLFNIYNKEKLFVNSFHHQAVCDPGERFRVTARSADGIIEAIESRDYKSILGVQWHPECMSAEDGSPIFSWLVQQAADYRRTCDLHQRILTLDTHCDTPMFFPQGVDFGSRAPRILVDLHKMSEGHQDATIMVCYLPQPQQDETFSSKVDFDVNGPTEYADLIFDKIETIVEQNKQYLAIARTPADLYANKQQGRKSIMLGIENGLALDGHLDRLQHFAQRGIVYMTLCHNGDNDICDSARGNHTHNGISSFGQQVVREMNRLGILVDLSHAGEKSFYDALELSSQPIVCSHSSCRALCDHPRNLTDDQMRALAAKGGVMQITMYNGFLVKDGEATVLDALRHLAHAIEVMGIDHVGIGTDFDGDGGVRGMANSSELLNFTRLLLARGYSEQDIEKIWGGNFLRVMTQVQSVRE
ncbi:MAG: gamma-glutamyl-gamma-aminobutyrate hydrolase family protein [Prevotella sp.]|nr:gamma-glutamyl-gamma-aminobutyrate hydrolase family protein [Prevotella sp.]